MTDAEYLTEAEMIRTEMILHDRFPLSVEPDLGRYQGPMLVTKELGIWMLTDVRSMGAMYGHA